MSTNKIKRKFTCKDSQMFIACGTILLIAERHADKLQEADTTYTSGYIESLKLQIDDSARVVLGTDKAAQLRHITHELDAMHQEARYDFSLTKILIENKYESDPAQRKELLTNLGFTEYYTPATTGSQQAMGQLLDRFAENLTPALEAAFILKGVPEARIARLKGFAAVYTGTNVLQEGTKGRRSTLTEEHILIMNGLYSQVAALCKMARRVFPKGVAPHDGFSFAHVVGAQSGFQSGSDANSSGPEST